MIAQRLQPRITLAMGSTAGRRGEAFHSHYAAAKGAIISFVKGLSTELARYNILVNCVAPGWVDTDMPAPVLKTKMGAKTVVDHSAQTGALPKSQVPFFAVSNLASLYHGRSDQCERRLRAVRMTRTMIRKMTM